MYSNSGASNGGAPKVVAPNGGAHKALGRAHLSYLPQRPPINLAFQDLTYTVQNGKSSKLILRSISGQFQSGQLTAILGPSGAGKSTLLNILAGYRVTGSTGQILTNGEPRNIKQFRKLSRYIMQEDLLQPLITVQEAMIIAADLKLGDTLDKQKKAVVVEEIVQLLRLDKARNTVTERLSGGERKRLSIALELLNNPPVIFLDEPTTGLDDVASSTCVSLLKRVARGGRTVICSVHTPSARLFAEFDHVYVVAEGRCAYQGTAAGVVPFLNELSLPCPKTYNPADFVIEVSSGEYGHHVDKMVAAVENGRNQSWREYGLHEPTSQELETMEIEQLNTGGVEKHNYKHGSTGCQQFSVLLKRMLLQTVRNKGYLWLRVGLHLFLGSIVAILFNRMGNDASKTINNFGFCFACMIAMLYTTMMPILLAFPSEVQLIKREYFNRWYGLRPYYAALVISRTPPTIFFSLMFISITYPITAQPLELTRIVMFASICILVALISESMGTVISSSLSVVSYIYLRVGLYFFLGSLVSVLFNKMGSDGSKTIYNFGYCFACTIAMLYPAIMPVLLSYPSEVKLIKREYFNRWYGLKPYYAALFVSRTPSTVLFSLIFVLMTYYFTDQPLEFHRVMMFSSTCVLIAMISEAMGTLISSTLGVVNSVFTGPASIVPLMLLAVYGIGNGDEPVPLIWKIARSCSFVRYGLEGLVVAVYGPPRADLVCPDHVAFCEFRNVGYFVKMMGMKGVSFWVDFFVLIAILIIMNLAAFYLLRQRLRPNYAFRAIRVIGRFIKLKMNMSN